MLASQSPRRKEILHFLSLPFEQASPNFDEESVIFSGDPINYVKSIAQRKAKSVAKKFPNAVIIAADTIVYKDGKIFLKPKDNDHALQTLLELAGNWHSVYTGITVWTEEKEFTESERTEVLFNNLSKEQLEKYIEKIDCLDKAGGYTTQEKGCVIARQINGCYYNTLGMPINTLANLLQKVGIDLWK